MSKVICQVLWIKARRASGPEPHPTGPQNQAMCDLLDRELRHLHCRTVRYKSMGGVIALVLAKTAEQKLVEEALEELAYVIHGEGQLSLESFQVP